MLRDRKFVPVQLLVLVALFSSSVLWANPGRELGAAAIPPVDSSAVVGSTYLVGTELDIVLEGTCSPSVSTLCLLVGNRFRVEVDWTDFSSNSGIGRAELLLDDTTGYFWFEDEKRPDMYLKMVDGRAFNGFFWVFFGSMTNWRYTLSITDTVSGASRDYINPLGMITSVADVEAFAGSVQNVLPLELGSAAASGSAGTTPRASDFFPGISPSIFDSGFEESVRDPSTGSEKSRVYQMGQPEGGTCISGATTLCLINQRFQIEVEWRGPDNSTGVGQAMPVTSQSGAFWLFDPSSIDLMAKVVDATDINGSIWFYLASTINVEFTLNLTDTCTGQVVSYFNPLGTRLSFADFDAFLSTPACSGLFEDGFESGNTSEWSNSQGN